MDKNEPVLELDDVSVSYDSPAGAVQAVNHVSMKIYPNTIVGLVGESGSGKSTLANAIMHLLKGNARLTSGKVKVMGQDIYSMGDKELRQFRWNRMSMVFQSAMNALNPVLNVEAQMVDTLRSHRKGMSYKAARKRSRELLELVSIDSKYLRAFPHELSGGMRQRIVIAIAVALEPDLVIMDEPTTALDVVVQRSILDKIRDLQKTQKFAILLISHDFSLVTELCSSVAIMYAGRLIEKAHSETLDTEESHHPYTQGLMRAIPKLTADDVVIEGIPGNPPDLVDLPVGCAYHPRCPFAYENCRSLRPELHEVRDGLVECHLYEKSGS
ncbi:MAG TPA: ABC transporter ATP-binding protein [Bacillales bacterium]